MKIQILPIAILAATISACTSPERPVLEDPRTGRVGVTEVDAAVPTEMRLVLASNESFQSPLPAPDNGLPDYPPDLLARRLPPQSVCVRISIDEFGIVTDGEPVDQGPDCNLGMDVESAFYAAAVAAVSEWRFEPAFRCIYPEGNIPELGCGSDGTREVPQPVSLIYRFVFEQIDGQARVGIE
ncbi:hypothetical protein OS176_04065 [Xanthomonadaceae bacterium XH05]|nr:hypothetical protein [Xanthomonadaceae bacterium XH05]